MLTLHVMQDRVQFTADTVQTLHRGPEAGADCLLSGVQVWLLSLNYNGNARAAAAAAATAFGLLLRPALQHVIPASASCTLCASVSLTRCRT